MRYQDSNIKKIVIAGLAVIVFLFGVFLFLYSQNQEENRVVKIGYVNPTTGVLAGNGEGYSWIIEKIYDYVRENPIIIGGKEVEFEIIVYDSESDQNTCTEVAMVLARDDKVDMMIAIQTPETVIPVTAVAEEYGVPCVSIQAPVDPVAAARDEYKWTFHAFWTIDKVYECYRGLWEKAGFPPSSGARVGMLFADDADGTAWHDVFLKRMKEDGYIPVDPGQYPVGNRDFTKIAQKFYEEKIDIITGTNLPSDYMLAMDAVTDRGLEVSCITMGKCALTGNDAEGMGERAIGLMSEVWWDPSNGYISELTGENTRHLSESYSEENFGRTMSQSASYGYAALELCIHALRNANTTDKKRLAEALSELDVDTIVGPVRYDKKMKGLTYGDTIISGGQWQLDDGEFSLKIIDNSVYPEVSVNGEYRPGNVTTGDKN